MKTTDAYILCGTPRTGSTLLCSFLKSTKVAGIPESYFREPDETAWASQWGITRSEDDSFTNADYVRAALNAGRTKNGVFGARIMWGSMEPLLNKLRAIYPNGSNKPLDLIEHVFGKTRFIYLKRENVLAQAISWLRAEQTDIWHQTTLASSLSPTQTPRFDYHELSRYISLIDLHNEAWISWFAEVGVQPYILTYEEFDSDPVGMTYGLLEFFGIRISANIEIEAPNIRMADEITIEWMERYRAMATDQNPSISQH